MSRAKGINSKLAMAYENTYGQTPVPAVGYNMPFNQSRLNITQNFIESTTIRSRRDKEQPAIGNIDVSGSVVVPMDQVGFGYWLRAMFNDPVTTSSAGLYTHVFKVTNNQPSMVLEQQYPDIPVCEMYNGCKVSNFSFTYGGEQELTANIDIIGARREVSESSFVPFLSDFSLLKFNNFQGTIEEGGVQLAIVTEANLSVNFGLDANTYAIGGGGYRTDLPEGSLVVSGNIKAFFTDTELLNKAINNTQSSLKFKFASETNSLQFYMEEVVFQQTSPGIETDKGIMINLPFKAFYDNGAGGSIITATLVNNHASYLG